jgi:hypothetical protein
MHPLEITLTLLNYVQLVGVWYMLQTRDYSLLAFPPKLGKELILMLSECSPPFLLQISD